MQVTAFRDCGLSPPPPWVGWERRVICHLTFMLVPVNYIDPSLAPGSARPYSLCQLCSIQMVRCVFWMWLCVEVPLDISSWSSTCE